MGFGKGLGRGDACGCALASNAAYMYNDVGAEAEDQFYVVLGRLRDAGFTIVQGSEVSEVLPSATIAEMLAAQESDQGFQGAFG